MTAYIPVPYGNMLRVYTTDQLLLAAKQEPYKKASPVRKNVEESSGKKVSMGQLAAKKIRQKE